MPIIQLSTLIDAPIERVFDLSRSIDAHQHSTTNTSEVAVSGTTSGLINYGEEVEWEACHFGIRQRLSVRITKLEKPHHFQDSMIKGVFSMMQHDHYFKEVDGTTEVKDIFQFKAPLGILGRIAEKLFLTRYMTLFLKERNRVLKRLAETDEWKKFLNHETV
jgi:ligand-binding SRPBCC domain-containing protein